MLTSLFAFLLSHGPSAPETATTPTSPAPVPAAPMAVPELSFERIRLANGLEVILHSDRRVPLVAVDVWYHVGSGDETPGKSGFAHLFEHMMFQGSKHVGADRHFDVLRQAGATDINGTTNSDRTNYFEVVPSHQIETALWLESDRMGYMLDLLTKASLANQIDVVRNERRQRYDNVPFGRELFAVAEALYPEGHPYRYLTIGRHEDLERASLEDVQAFFRKWYAPANATLCLVGDFDPITARQLVEKWFGRFPALERPGRSQVTTPALPGPVRREVEDPFARRPRLHLVWHSPKNLDEGDAELRILGRVLGAEGWGRLYRRLVLRDRAAHSVTAWQGGTNHTGEFHVRVDLKPESDLAAVRAAIQEELDGVLREPLAREEIERVLMATEASFVWEQEDVLDRAERLQYFNHFADDPGYTRTFLATMRSRTPEGILAVAQRVLSAPRVEIITRPKKNAAPKERQP